jgi:hypothetical protein
MKGLQRKNVPVTGGTSGIGQAIAGRFARESADLAINFLKNPEEAAETEGQVLACLNLVGQEGVREILVQGDVSREEDVIKMVAQVIEKLGGLDILINNAGIQIAVDIMPVCDERNVFAGYVTTYKLRAGELAGEYIAWKLREEGKLVLLEFNEISPGIDRRNGLRNIIRHFPGIEIVAEERAMTIPFGMSVTEAILQKYPNLDGVWCVNDAAGLDALRTLRNRGLDDRIFIVATDCNPQAVDEIRNGAAYKLTVVQFPVLIARYAVQIVSALLNGKEITSNIDSTDTPTWYTPIMPVTEDNWNQYPGWRSDIPTTLMMPWWK